MAGIAASHKNQIQSHSQIFEDKALLKLTYHPVQYLLEVLFQQFQ
jgi:hypothetical protein